MSMRLGLPVLLGVFIVAGVHAQREFQFFVSVTDASGNAVTTLSPTACSSRIAAPRASSTHSTRPRSASSATGATTFPSSSLWARRRPRAAPSHNAPVEQLKKRLATFAVTVHVVMFSSSARSTLGGSGGVQTNVGISAADITGGRYENTAVASRLATVLPEIGDQVALSHTRQSRQFRITFERPGGGSGPIGDIMLAEPDGRRAQLSLDGHLPVAR